MLRSACLGVLLPGLFLPGQGAQGGLEKRSSPLRVVEPDAHDRDLRTTPVVRAVHKAADSVVSIYLLGQHQPASTAPSAEGQGSGVILDAGGFVITNWHVVAPVLRGENLAVQVRQRDNRSRPARVLSASAEHDLALLQMELEPGETVQPVEIGRSADLMIGETVVAIGNPQGHANTVTAGVLSAIGRSIRVRGPDGALREYGDLLQTDAAINRGNSGGALLDITGKLIGINNAMAVGAENIGFAIPVDTVRSVFEGELTRSASLITAIDGAWLGLRLEERDGRLLVASVWPHGPAAEAGVRPGDAIVDLAGNEVQSPLDYARRMLSARPGRPLPLTVLRDNRRQALEPRPATRQTFLLQALAGLQVQEVASDQDPDLARRATRAFYSGGAYRRVPLLPAVLRVAAVDADGPAAALGLRAGDALLALAVHDPRFGAERDQYLASARDLLGLLAQRSGSSVRILVLRGDDDLVGTLEVRRIAAGDYL